jgi:hypothetical protein
MYVLGVEIAAAGLLKALDIPLRNLPVAAMRAVAGSSILGVLIKVVYGLVFVLVAVVIEAAYRRISVRILLVPVIPVKGMGYRGPCPCSSSSSSPVS